MHEIKWYDDMVGLNECWIAVTREGTEMKKSPI